MNDGLNEQLGWRAAFEKTFGDLVEGVVGIAPQVLGAVLLLAAGWIVARILRALSKRAVLSFDPLFRKISRGDTAQREKIQRSYAGIVGQGVFWAVMVFFVATTANLLGWELFTSWMDGIVRILPRLVTGLLIVLGGFLLSSVVRSLVLTAGNKAEITQAGGLARLAQAITIFGAIIIGVEQIGLEMHFLTTTFIVVVGILLGGACLAFGLGGKTLIENTIGAQYARKNCDVGDRVTIQGVEGKVLEVRQTCIVLETKEGRAVIPAKLFNEEISLLTREEEKGEPS